MSARDLWARINHLQNFQAKVIADLLPVILRLLRIHPAPSLLNDSRRRLDVETALRLESLEEGQKPLPRFAFDTASSNDRGPHQAALSVHALAGI